MLYVLATWTGYRRRELASLTLRSFNLDNDPKTVTVRPSYSKRRQQDVIPLHPVVVEGFQAWLKAKEGLSPTEPLFVLRTPKRHFRKTAKMMKRPSSSPQEMD